MVRDLLQRFGFEHVEDSADGSVRWSLPVSSFVARETEIAVACDPAAEVAV
jgi:hypothetical protein